MDPAAVLRKGNEARAAAAAYGTVRTAAVSSKNAANGYNPRTVQQILRARPPKMPPGPHPRSSPLLPQRTIVIRTLSARFVPERYLDRRTLAHVGCRLADTDSYQKTWNRTCTSAWLDVQSCTCAVTNMNCPSGATCQSTLLTALRCREGPYTHVAKQPFIEIMCSL